MAKTVPILKELKHVIRLTLHNRHIVTYGPSTKERLENFLRERGFSIEGAGGIDGETGSYIWWQREKDLFARVERVNSLNNFPQIDLKIKIPRRRRLLGKI